MFIGSINIENDIQSKYKYITNQSNSELYDCSPQSFGIHEFIINNNDLQ